MIENVEKAKNYAPEKMGRKEKRATVSGKINKRLISILFPDFCFLLYRCAGGYQPELSGNRGSDEERGGHGR